jgi:FYVE/RhoGEF/PH domain-containing protein 5/6
VHVDSLRPRFKKRDSSKHGPSSTRYVPQRLKVSSNGDGSLQMCGYLKKRLRNAKWKRMWFVLKDRVLYVYRASEDTVAAETFPILGYDLDTLSEVRKHC